MKDLLGHEFEFDRFYRQCQWHIVSKSKPLYIDELHGFHNKNTFNKVLRMWNCCRGRSGGFVGERARSLYIYIYLWIYTNTPKARFLTARTDFSFSQSLLRDLCWKHMKAPGRRLVWEKKLRDDITLEEAMAQFSHHIQNICRYVRYLSYFHYRYINTYYISNC